MLDKNVLIIDDDAIILRMVTLFLQKECNVFAVNSGEAGLEFLDKNHVDLVFLDYEMPGMKGPEVFAKIREREACKELPIVFMTGASDQETIASCNQLNPYAYLEKPVSCDKLKQIVAEAFVQ